MESDTLSTPQEISSLKKILLENIKEYYSSGSITLHEIKKGATLHNVFVAGLTPSFFALKPDKAKINFFARGYGSKQCDYILLSEFKNKRIVVFVELKSSVFIQSASAETPCKDPNGKYEDYVTQLKSSSCLWDYLHAVLSRFETCNVLGNDYKRYFVVLHNKDVPPIGRDIPLTRPSSNDTPENAYIRRTEDNEHLQLSQLIR